MHRLDRAGIAVARVCRDGDSLRTEEKESDTKIRQRRKNTLGLGRPSLSCPVERATNEIPRCRAPYLFAASLYHRAVRSLGAIPGPTGKMKTRGIDRKERCTTALERGQKKLMSLKIKRLVLEGSWLSLSLLLFYRVVRLRARAPPSHPPPRY